MLVLASAALSEVSTFWLYAVIGSSQHLKQGSLDKLVFLFKQTSFNEFSRQCERYKYCLSCRRTFGLVSQACATIDRFFNL